MRIDRELLLKIGLKNAFLHSGKASVKAIVNKVIGSSPELRDHIKEVAAAAKEIASEIEHMSESEIRLRLLQLDPDSLTKEKAHQKRELPDLEVLSEKVVMRLAPSPSGPLHIGHSRMAILNDEYVKRYGGELILRIEDTNPRNIDPIAYSQIPEDLRWLNVNVTSTIIQSERMDIYYREAEKLLSNGHAYICSCSPEVFRKLKLSSQACPHRDTSVSRNLESFKNILKDRNFARDKTLVIKTDLKHPNPSVRDWIAFRFVDYPHPRTGSRYWFYPTMNFSVAIDDHLLGLTHVMRGKDHLNNTEKQRYIYRYNKWKEPKYYHFGLVSIPDTILHASEMRDGIRSGRFSGWDDVRLGTLMAMKKRGYLPETFRRYWVESGLRESDAEFSWEIFDSINRELIDRSALRFSFVRDPFPITFDVPYNVESESPYHPEVPSLGFRRYSFYGRTKIYLSKEDFLDISLRESVRLKDFCNLKIEGHSFIMEKENKPRKGIKIINWVPENARDYEVQFPDGNIVKGKIEPLAEGYDGVSQFERFGYVRMYKNASVGYFLHK